MLLRITIPDGTDPATVPCVLQLNSNAIGIGKVELLGVAARMNHRLDAASGKLLVRGLRIAWQGFTYGASSVLQASNPAATTVW